ncbi:MAG: diguanylate cyclase [Pseudomonadota bacterium]
MVALTRLPLPRLLHRFDAWWSGRVWVPRIHRAQQGRLIQERVATLARMLAALVVGWVPLDLYALQREELMRVLPLRLLLAVALLALARFATRLSPVNLVRLVLWAQVAGFGAMSIALESMHASVMHLNYTLVPFLVVAQLAALPLPWIRSLRAALIPAWLLVIPLASADMKADPPFWRGVWLYGTIAAIAAWVGHSQLRLLVDLLGARRDALHDALTGLPNRRAAEARLAVERARAHRGGAPLSLLMLDIDHFKRVNDRWGHADGDRVLAAVARLLAREVRECDLAARFGGEEFLVVLPDSGPREALDVAERIRALIERTRVDVPNGRIGITVSIGAATLRSNEDEATLLARADAALYRAKAAGRNRTEAA